MALCIVNECMGWATQSLLFFMGVSVACAQERAAFDLNDRGLEAASHGNFAAAERMYSDAIDLWRKLGPAYEAHLATTEANMAQSLCGEGKRRAAVELFEDALRLYRRTVGPKDLHTVTTMNLLGSVYLILGDYDRSMPLFQEALTTARELYPNDLEVARALDGLASIDNVRGKTDEALPMAEEALAIVLKTQGEHCPDAALAYANIGETHRLAGRRDRAFPLFRKAQSIYEEVYGPENSRVAFMLTEEGLLLMSEGKLALAEKEMVRALDILQRRCPDCAVERWVAERNLGILRFRQRKYDEAESMLMDALSLQEAGRFRTGPDIGETLQKLAAVREKQRRYDDAARLQKRAALILSYQ